MVVLRRNYMLVHKAKQHNKVDLKTCMMHLAPCAQATRNWGNYKRNNLKFLRFAIWPCLQDCCIALAMHLEKPQNLLVQKDQNYNHKTCMQKAMYLLSVKAGEIVRISHLSFLTLLEFHIELFLLTAWPKPAHQKKKLEYFYIWLTSPRYGKGTWSLLRFTISDL